MSKSYSPVLNRAGLLIQKAQGNPLNREQLMMKALNKEGWELGKKSRQIARRSLTAFRNWAVLHGKLIAAYAPPAHIPEIMKTKAIGYALSDEQIIGLLNSIHKGRHRAEKETYNSWKFVIQLYSVYGLKPEELRHLSIKEGSQGKELWSVYQKSKGGKKGEKTEPRQLHPLLIKYSDGIPIDWNLQKRIEVGEKLPPLGQLGHGGEALGTFLKRRKYWQSLRSLATATGEVLKPYSFRHRYEKESHAAGFSIANICKAMGHSIEVHLGKYARFTPDGTADMYTKRNAKAA